MRKTRFTLLLATLAWLSPSHGFAQIKSMEIETPRNFGYYIGDIIHHEVTIAVDEGYTLSAASLPRPGSLAYWLELHDISVDEKLVNGTRTYRIELNYQTFFAPFSGSLQHILPFTLTFSDGENAVQQTIPRWTFTTSPLMEFHPDTENGVDVMQADYLPQTIATTPHEYLAGIFGLLSVLMAFLLARYYGLWPFHKRKDRPFLQARREMRKLLRTKGENEGFLPSMSVLHRAFDKVDGQSVFAGDLSAFLQRHPQFLPLESDISRFFIASQLGFFQDDQASASSALSIAELMRLTARLGAAERGKSA